MIDTLGFHVDRNYRAELDDLNTRIARLSDRVTANWFSTFEERTNTWSQLGHLRFRAHALTKEVAMEDQRIGRLTDALQIVGDPAIGFIAYVAFGPDALPLDAMYEVRLIEPNGIYTVPGGVRTNLPESRVESAVEQLRCEVAARHAKDNGFDAGAYRVQVTAF